MLFQASDLAYIIPVIFISMAIHEAMHAFVAHWLGDTTAKDMGRLTLNPLAHVDLYTTILLPVVLILLHLQPIFAAKPVPFNPNRVKYDEYGAALVGISGPVTNFVLAGISAVILRNIVPSVVIGNFLAYFTIINVAFFVFNMIPIPPLDGSRLLYAFAPEPLQRIMYRIESMGFVVFLVIIIVLLPVIGPLLTYLDNHVLHFLLGSIYPI